MEPSTALPTQAACASCSTTLRGPYCHACGEKILHRHDYSFHHFAEHLIDGITHFDLRVLRDLGQQLRRPGWLAAEWLQGRRVRHAAPVQLFLVTNVLFYLISGKAHFSPFQTQLGAHLHGSFSRLAHRLLAAHLAHTGQTYAQLVPRFDELIHVYSKTLVFIFVPLLAGPLALLCWRQRRYFVEWLTITLYWFGGVLLVFGLGALLALSAHFSAFALQFFNNDGLVGPTMFGISTLYTYFFLGGVFPGSSALGRAAQSLALVVCFLLALLLPYRLLLFLLTLWTV